MISRVTVGFLLCATVFSAVVQCRKNDGDDVIIIGAGGIPLLMTNGGGKGGSK